MKGLVRKVNLLKPFDVSNINIKRDSYFPNAYIVDLPLDSIPDHVWQDIFERKWKTSRHLWDRKIFVLGDKLRLVTTATDFREKLDWSERMIHETNRAIDEHDLLLEQEEEIRIKKEVNKQTLWKEKVNIETIKDVLRKKFA